MSPRTTKVQQTDSPSRDRFSLWLRAIIAGEYRVQLKGSDGYGIAGSKFAEPVAQKEFASKIGVSERVLRTYIAHTKPKGPSPDLAWDIGERIAEMKDREWCAGILSVAALPIYHVHVLRWVGVLIAQHGKSKLTKTLWPLLANLATTKAFVSRPNPMPNMIWTPQMRADASRAWARIGSVEDELPDAAPAIIKAAVVLQNAIGHTGELEERKLPLSVSLPQAAMVDALHQWFNGIENNWATVKHF